MAQFTEKKVVFSEINGGNEYTEQDAVQANAINSAIEGAAYAQTKSDEAVETATSANNTANAASAKVDTFDQRITTAQNTADTAVSNAATAQSTADSATTEINKIKNGTTVVPNANHANNADSADMATKAQQDVNGNPINTTYATVEYVDDLVTEQQGTRVKVNNVNVAQLSFTSDPQTQISDIVDGSQTVGKAKRDANGNVIDTTYAKLTQVVRVDAAQSLTDEEKTRAKDNLVIQTTKGNSNSITEGWYRVAKLARNKVYAVVFGETFNYNSPSNAKLILNIGHSTAVITQCGIRVTSFTPNRVRTCVATGGDVFFDIYIPDTSVNTVAIYIEKLYVADGNPRVDTYDDWEYIGTDDTVSGYDVTLLDLVSGTNTSGGVYQNGAPVFATDPSKLSPSIANGWTFITATGSLPSDGVYMVSVNKMSYGIGIMVYTEGKTYSSTILGVYDSIRSLVYAPSNDTKWHVYDGTGKEMELTDVYYKRIV